ncbi:MAG: hypothetical protein GY873_29185 [Bosea sp.]|uniref:hypothetical protein n=1 Tax=Bosea sp. (in: a-proteobacteria) TaxID=1871050 RepID=UPI0023A44F65|nr:hypothetical protein [Bosea sp. (in: a-proteobacteria)]MCP4738271.1 hypothetical protein [Bosea sp. (in: a-proteobacteria)]
MIKPEHVALAVEKLKGPAGKRRPGLDEAAEILAGFRPFSDMDDDELLPIAEAALKALASAPPPPPAASQPRGQRDGAGRRSPRQDPPAELLTAPYRFVDVPDQVVLAPAAAKDASYDFPLAGGFSGTLGVTWAVETPVAVGQAEGGSEIAGPARLGNRYVLPGPTLRGLVRAAMSIVTRARLTQINGNHTYGVRDFTHPLFAESDGRSRRLAWPNLGAGWLRRQEASPEERREGLSDYVLTPCDKKLVRIRALPAGFNRGQPTNNGAFHLDWLNSGLRERYRRAGYLSQQAPAPLYDFETVAATSFSPDPAAPASDPAAADYVMPAAGGRGGWFVFASRSPATGKVSTTQLDEQQRDRRAGNQKKLECVFMDRPGAGPVRLPQAVFDRFELINSRPGKTRPKPEGSYAELEPTLRAGRRIPVFYSGELREDNTELALGLTRLFKLPHANSVEAIRDRQPAHKPRHGDPDMVEALFGHVYDRFDLKIDAAVSLAPGEVARKGRLAFGFAMLDGDVRVASALPVVSTVASAPRASFAPFYLKGRVKDWTDESAGGRMGEARLAGRKRYFARYPQAALANAGASILAELNGRRGNGNEEMLSQIRFLRAAEPGGELRFTGEIRLHNLLPEEIGALLWTLTHGGDPDKPYRHMIGRAKNAGAGQTRVKRLDLRLDAHPGEGSNAGLLQPPAAWEGQSEGWLAEGSRSMAPFLQAFEAHMRRADGAWPEGARDIQEFLGVSDPREARALPAGFIPTPNDHGKLRRTVKADSKLQDPANPERLLTTPRLDAKRIRLPYRG